MGFVRSGLRQTYIFNQDDGTSEPVHPAQNGSKLTRQVNLLSPLSQLPYLHLLQVGSYTWTPSAQLEILSALVHVLPKLLVLGVLNQQYQTSWWGIWRDRGPNGFGGRDSLQGRLPQGGVQVGEGIWGVPLAEGHLGWLEREMGVEPPRVGMGVVEEMKDGEDVVME